MIEQTHSDLPSGYEPSDLSNHELFQIETTPFSGPLDLLLFLIQKHKLNIFDIPIATITDKYLEKMEQMKELHFEAASEFLYMASVLLHLKSKELLPKPEKEEDPEEIALTKEMLEQQLQLYMAFKMAGQQMADRPILNRDTFANPGKKQELRLIQQDPKFKEISVFELTKVFGEILSKHSHEAPIQIILEKVSVSEKIRGLTSKLSQENAVGLHILFLEVHGKRELIALFLAILEMTKLQMISILLNTIDEKVYLRLKDLPKDTVTESEWDLNAK